MSRKSKIESAERKSKLLSALFFLNLPHTTCLSQRALYLRQRLRMQVHTNRTSSTTRHLSRRRWMCDVLCCLSMQTLLELCRLLLKWLSQKRLRCVTESSRLRKCSSCICSTCLLVQTLLLFFFSLTSHSLCECNPLHFTPFFFFLLKVRELS